MKRTGIWITTGLLVVPVVVFYLLNAGSQNFKTLPILGERIPPSGNQKDTLYHHVPDVALTDQNGAILHQKDLESGITVVNFFFASCKDICPSMNRRLSGIYEKYKEFSELQFLTVTVDLENDSLPVLEATAEKYHADPKIWHFARTNNPDDLFTLGRGCLLPVSVEDKTIDHSQQLILLDKQHRIRGFYDSGSDADLRNLEEDIKVLLYEYHHPGK